MATAREVLALVITADGRGAINEFRKVSRSAKDDLGQAEKSAKGMGAATSAALIAGGAGLAAAGGSALLGLKKLSDGYVNAATESIKLQRVTGGTAEDVSRLRFVAQRSGLGVDQLATALVRFSKNSQAKGGQNLLDQWGISLKNAQGETRPLIEVFTQIAAKFEQLPNGAAKNAAALTLFGRAGAELLPILNRGAAGIADLAKQSDALGTTLDQRDLDGVKQYVQSRRELNAALEGLKITAGREAFPAVAGGLAKVTTGAKIAAETAAKIPPEFRAVAGTAAFLGGSTAVAAGGLAVLIGAGSRVLSTFRGADDQLTRTGQTLKGLALAAGVLAIGEAIGQGLNSVTGAAQRADDAINRVVGSSKVSQLGELANAFSAEARKFSLTEGPEQLLAKLGLGVKRITIPGISFEPVPSTDAQVVFDRIKAASEDTAATLLDNWEKQNEALNHNSDEYKNNKAFIDENRRSLDAAKAAQSELTGQTDQMSASTDRATYSINAQAFALQYAQNAAESTKGVYVTYADALKAAFDPVLGLMDANDKLADAQTRLAEISRGSTTEVISATKRLADAQQRLNDVLSDDPLMGLKSVSAESQLADARNRLAAANERLAANPNDAIALTAKDTAISDLEAASRRAQEDKRNAASRARQIRDASQAVSDARGELATARSKTGPSSKEYQDAARDVLRANLDVQSADAQLAQYIRDNGVQAIGEINAKLDEWATKGGPVGQAAATIRAQVDPLVGQAQGWATQLGIVNSELGKLSNFQFAPGTVGAFLFGQGGFGAAGQGSGPTAGSAQGTVNSNATWQALDRLRQFFQPGNRANGVNPGTGGGGGGGGSFASGGLITGPGSGRSDSILARVSNGEFVMTADAVRRWGVPFLEQLNDQRIPRFANGGLVRGFMAPTAPAWSRPGDSITIAPTIHQYVPRPEDAGAAVVSALRGVAHRSGRGLRLKPALGG